jgi:hypothetical protein
VTPVKVGEGPDHPPIGRVDTEPSPSDNDTEGKA